MARNRYGPQAASRRPATADQAQPSGLLLHVLLDYWDSLSSELRSSVGVTATAALGQGFHACAGMGCDMSIEVRAHGVLKKGRCGDRPCAWFSYQLKAGGVVLGVRACTEHHGSAIQENMWTRSPARAEDFYAWEVMST
jgi:hypothetical protein